jgi:hypothetical protein
VIAAVGLIFGAVLVALGVLVRLGYLRARPSVRWARDPKLPHEMRNGVFALIPVGLFFLSGSVASLIGDRWPVATGAIIVIGVLAMAFGLVTFYRPPEWMKPPWLREERRAHHSRDRQ